MTLNLWRGLAACTSPDVIHGATSIFSPDATPAHSIFGLSMLVLGITLSIFFVVAGLLLYALLRFRQRDSDPNPTQEPAQIYGSAQIELSWTVIPILIVVMLFLATARVIYTTEHAVKPPAALDVTVIGHQFWWEFRYPKFGIVTANELHIPVSNPDHPQPTYLTMSSADTDHSFWVPRLAGKMDVLPNRVNVMWMDPATPGLYLGQCAQYCGTQHAKMLLRVYADTPAQFAAWVVHQQQPAHQQQPMTSGSSTGQSATGQSSAAQNTTSQGSSPAQGQAVFEHNACISCHTIAGTVATGRFGPDLTHVASRDTIASGAVTNTTANMRAWVDDPAHFKPGARMPPMHLNHHDLDAVTAYLGTLK